MREDQDEAGFDNHVAALRSVADVATQHGAILTFEFSNTFLDGVMAWNSTIIDELRHMGHGTGVHADVGGQGVPSRVEMARQLTRIRGKAESLGVDTRHVSGVCSAGPWVDAVRDAGFQSVNGVVEYCALALDAAYVPSTWGLEQCVSPFACHGPLDVSDDILLYPYFADGSADFIVPKESGLVIMIGASGSTPICRAEGESGGCTGNADDLPFIDQELQHYLDTRDSTRIANLSMSWSIGSVPDEDFANEFFSLFDVAVASGEAIWMSNGDIGQMVIDS